LQRQRPVRTLRGLVQPATAEAQTDKKAKQGAHDALP
jgi:hypothetical protein